jgi:hypothetical protein
LQSMGLVHLEGNLATPSCKLYYHYFCDRLLGGAEGNHLNSTLFEWVA